MNQHKSERKQKIAIYGHFNSTNFGNESTLQAILYHLRCFQPDAEITCISTGPDATVAAHQIEAVPIVEKFLTSWQPRNPISAIPPKADRVCMSQMCQ